MKITPTLVLESVDKLKSTTAFRTDIMPMVKALIEQAVLFTFAEEPCELAEHCAFAIDLYERGLFTLPFPVTALSFERDLGYLDGRRFGKRGGMLVLTMDKEGSINAISCSELDEPTNGPKAIPVGVAMRVRVERDGPRAGKIHNDLVASVVNDKIAAAMFGAGEAGAENMRERLLNNTVNAMALVVMLMSKGVTTEMIPASDKLNKARAKRGKPPIRDRYVVKVEAGEMRTIHHADGSTSDITGHTRGSPRLHWRRGHFRTLYRGTEAERVVPVAPALIGANENAETVRAKAYEVTT